MSLGVDAPVDFVRDIRPLLSDRCFRCHGPDESAREAGLRLDLREAAVADREGGPAVMPGQPHQSQMLARLRSTDPDERMPPAESGLALSHDEIESIQRWIGQGASYAPHWSFTPIKRPPSPVIHQELRRWTQNPIDEFVLARLESERLSPSSQADLATLVRRVTLDLTGLPARPADVAAFLSENHPNAYERYIDRLLASPRFGERLAVWWLEASRYADTNGYQHDFYRTVYPWRTWVIRALNGNMPFDQFVVEQLAGDLLPESSPEQVLATCYLRLHRMNSENGSIDEEFYVENVVDRIETVSTALMGLTMGCARCHDHKFDPITMRDFYSLFAYLNNGQEKGTDPRGLHKNPWSPPVLRYPDAFQRTELRLLEARLQRGATETDALAIQEKMKEIRQLAPAVMVMREREERRPSFILTRGSYDRREEQVSPGTPAVLPEISSDVPDNRLGFARWLTSPEHPLLARVAVNQYWQMFFGVGLVGTPENFGVQGEPPTHPQMLDWLASEFIHSRWNVKLLLRSILGSATYRQSSQATPSMFERDPENRLLARGARFRLSGFTIRDQALAASGLLIEMIGGPSVRPYQPSGMWAEVSGDQGLGANIQTTFYKQDNGEGLYRRSLYTFWKRSVPPPTLSTFDAPNREACVVRRSATNTPLQALALMNDTTYLEVARHLALHMLRAGDSIEQRVNEATQRLLARPPTENELLILQDAMQHHREFYTANPTLAQEFLSHGESPQVEGVEAVEHAALSQIALMLLNLDETITKE